MNRDNRQLITSATRLYKQGLKVEKARKRLKALMKKRVPYTAPETLEALKSFQELNAQFKELEQEHLDLRSAFVNR